MAVVRARRHVKERVRRTGARPVSAHAAQPVSGVEADELGVTLGRVSLVASTAAQLHRALREEKVVLAARAVVAASGHQDTPLGEAAVVVVGQCALTSMEGW